MISFFKWGSRNHKLTYPKSIMGIHFLYLLHCSGTSCSSYTLLCVGGHILNLHFIMRGVAAAVWLSLVGCGQEFMVANVSTEFSDLVRLKGAPCTNWKTTCTERSTQFHTVLLYLYLQDPSKKPPLWFETENIHIQETGIRELTTQIDLLSKLLVIGLILIHPDRSIHAALLGLKHHPRERQIQNW